MKLLFQEYLGFKQLKTVNCIQVPKQHEKCSSTYKRSSWSQDEGFALFLILDKLTLPETWVKDMFGYKTKSIVDLIIRKLP
jgi:hypothetical protein